jgi:CheY-like chemotaxis protein
MPAPVLVVEDDEDGREIMRLLLEDAGYTVLEAKGAYVALELLRAPAPARMVVVLDLLMRDGTGFELLAAVAQEPALAERHAYIVCSAHKREPGDIGPHFAALLKLLGIPFISKPYDIEVMLAAVAVASRRLDVAARPWTASDTA